MLDAVVKRNKKNRSLIIMKHGKRTATTRTSRSRSPKAKMYKLV